jgi:hypothetical protein
LKGSIVLLNLDLDFEEGNSTLTLKVGNEGE